MCVKHLHVLVEEPSMEAALRILLGKILTKISYEIFPYQGKSDLMKQLPRRLKAYKKWFPENWAILVLVDRDQDNCIDLKNKLERFAAEAEFVTKSNSGGQPYTIINRIAIEELEAWYFGDWDAVKTAYPRVPVTIPQKSGYRYPDDVSGGTWEIFERVLQRAGYFSGGLRKIEAARTIAEHMNPGRNNSRSFQVLHEALFEMNCQNSSGS